MITSKDKIQIICNYSEKFIEQQTTQLMYVDIISSDDVEYKLAIKRQNRELAVDAILDDKVEEFEIFRENQPIDVSADYNSPTQFGVMGPKIMKINLTAQNFENYEKIYQELVNFLDQNTKSQKSLPNRPTTLDVQLTGDFEQDRRKVITKVLMSSNIIAMEGRLGPATCLICGQNVYQYIVDQITNMTVILDYSIDHDKVIMCRSNNIDQPGLLLIDSSQNKKYFLKETPNWHRQYCWFLVK